jgi:hypothetical protein
MKWTLSVALLLITLGNAQTVSSTKAKTEQANSADREKNIQAYIALLRADVRQKKTDVMSAVMQLDVEDASKFWPIYRDFEAELKEFYDQVGAGIKTYAANIDKMDDAMADQLGTKVLNLEQQRNEMKRKYYVRFKTALDPIVAMRFLQVENQIERITDLQVASELPIVQKSQR